MDPLVVDLSVEGADQLIEEPKTVEPSPGAVNATKKRKGETAEDKRKRKKGRQELLRATETLHSLYPRNHIEDWGAYNLPFHCNNGRRPKLFGPTFSPMG